MNALEEREKKHLNTAGKNIKLLINQPPKELFKVVVNNYRQKEKSQDKEEDEIFETMMSHREGLPAQPGGYLKFPDYDWF